MKIATWVYLIEKRLYWQWITEIVSVEVFVAPWTIGMMLEIKWKRVYDFYFAQGKAHERESIIESKQNNDNCANVDNN